MSPLRPARPAIRLRRMCAALVGLALTLVLSVTHAHAQPSPAEVEGRLAELWNQAEPLIERYNEVHEQYQQNKARQEQLVADIAPLAHQLQLAQVRVGAVAAEAYQGRQNDTLSALFAAGTPQNLADQLTYLDQLAYDQTAQLADVVRAKREYDRQKEPIDALVADLQRQDSELAAQRAEIEARLDELQGLRVQAYGAAGIASGSYRPSVCPAEYLPTKGYQAAAFACNETGKPYVWAASGPSAYDCSGLTLAAWRKVGVYLPHNAAAQRRSMKSVSRADLQIGDLVFYFRDLHHVAIYVGDGLVVHAPHAGDRVRMAPIDKNPVHSYGRPG